MGKAKDVVVLGGGVGGLSAAIYARLLGHRVCILEAHSKVGGKAAGIEVKGYRLDPGPSIIILIRIYNQLFRDAGREISSYLKFDRLDPISRVFFGSGDPIDLPGDRSKCESLVSQLSQSDGDSFRRLFRALDHVSPRVDRTIFAHPYDRSYQLMDPNLVGMAMHLDLRSRYKDLIDRWFQSPMLRAFFYGFPSYGGQTYDSKSIGALLIPYLMIEEGVFYPKGGVRSVPEALERLAIELGVEIRTGTRVTKLILASMKGKPSVGEAVLEGGERIQAEVFISGVDRQTTRGWLGHKTTLEPNMSYFTVHWGVREKYPQLRHHTLLIPDNFEAGFQELYRNRRFPTPPIVYLNETSEIDPANAPKACSNLFAVVTSPANTGAFDWNEKSPGFRDQVVQTMARFGIEVPPSKVQFERIQTPLYFEEAHGNYRGSLYGLDERHRLFGIFPDSNADSEYKNLFYCGGSVQPGAGLPMAVLSGKFAAGKI